MEDYIRSSLIGEGSFGKVYKATEKKTQNVVALKILSKRGRNSKRALDIQQLRRECDIQKDLKHPNIICLLKTFETENEIVFVTEFAPADLHSLLEKVGTLNEASTRKITYDLVSALYYLHSHRVLHRDLKPQNILLDSENHAKLCDFGLARNMTSHTHVLTSIKGTPLYMSPELLDEKPYDYMADLWSLGCILYELLVGQPPFYTHSIMHLARLIKHRNIKWPSFISPDCYSFLDNLLVIDPTQRITWPQILIHPFVEGHVLILDELIQESPFTHPMSDTEAFEKEQQASKLLRKTQHMPPPDPQTSMADLNIEQRGERDENLLSSRDSINAILQSDVEQIETDFEEMGAAGKEPLERKKLNQNLENFSVRLGSLDIAGKNSENESEKIQEEIEGTNKMTPTLLPGWDSCEDAQNPPIENEEWIVFIHRTMQELLNGEFDQMLQQNFVSILVAPLRNTKTSAKVIELVSQLFMLPLVMVNSVSMSQDIKKIYAEVKLVANLVYASKLLCKVPAANSNQSAREQTYRSIDTMSCEELKTLTCIYELVCHLCHATMSNFLNQFYDAIALLGVHELLHKILVSSSKQAKRLKASVLALLACVLRESPENADLIETITFDPRLKTVDLLKESHALCRYRALILLRLTGRYCCVALQKNWNEELKAKIQQMTSDHDEAVRNQAADVLEEFKNLSFY